MNRLPPRVHRSRLSVRDLLAEALAGMVQRPGRAALTALGTVLGVAAFVTVIGLTASASGQISKRFTVLTATEVTVEDVSEHDGQAVGGDGEGAGGGAGPDTFPADADTRARAINGVRHAGVWWTVDDQGTIPVTGVPVPGVRDPGGVPITAASAGLLRAVHATVREGRLYDEFSDRRGEQVAVLGAAAAEQLGISALVAQPAVFIDGNPYLVVGILDDVARDTDLLFSVIVPRHTAELFLGPPRQGSRAKMLIETRPGAAGVVSAQAALALRPDAPDLFKVNAPPDPTRLRDQVSSDLSVLFLLLAGVCLVIGAIGIANTTMVAVLERVPEIGLRRALGARPRHIAAQFLVESAAAGTGGGLVGTSLGVVVVVVVALIREWTAVLEPLAVLASPLIGTIVGVLAGLYPAIRAARIEPVEALRR